MFGPDKCGNDYKVVRCITLYAFVLLTAAAVFASTGQIMSAVLCAIGGIIKQTNEIAIS